MVPQVLANSHGRDAVGNQILHTRVPLSGNLRLARLRILSLFPLATRVVGVSRPEAFDDAGALLAAMLLTARPSLLAHRPPWTRALESAFGIIPLAFGLPG